MDDAAESMAAASIALSTDSRPQRENGAGRANGVGGIKGCCAEDEFDADGSDADGSDADEAGASE